MPLSFHALRLDPMIEKSRLASKFLLAGQAQSKRDLLVDLLKRREIRALNDQKADTTKLRNVCQSLEPHGVKCRYFSHGCVARGVGTLASLLHVHHIMDRPPSHPLHASFATSTLFRPAALKLSSKCTASTWQNQNSFSALRLRRLSVCIFSAYTLRFHV